MLYFHNVGIIFLEYIVTAIYMAVLSYKFQFHWQNTRKDKQLTVILPQIVVKKAQFEKFTPKENGSFGKTQYWC